MKVKELVAKLNLLNQELDVAGYASNAEASFVINGVEVISEKNQPYDKGDSLYDKYKPLTSEMVLLSGWD